MIIGERLRLLREGKNLSQGDIEERTGLKRCYISRVENGHTVPGIETLEKIARALEVPLFRLFYDGEESPKVLRFPTPEDASTWGSSNEETNYLKRLCKFLPHIDQRNRRLLLRMLSRMTGQKPTRSGQ